MRRIRVLAGAATLLLALSSTSLSAQLRMGGSDSNFGSVTLSPGFTPDPHSVSIISGGSQNVRDMNMGSGCVGYATSDPDYIVNFTGSSDRLRFFVEGDGDTGLIVAAPGKQFLCNDDSEGLDPMVTFDGAQAGQYNVWVSSYSSGDNISSTLYVTELDYAPGDFENSGSSSVSGRLNIGGDDSNFGRTSLNAGFMPDPHTVYVTSGGSTNARDLNLGSGCVGYVTRDPDFILDYDSGMSMLRFFMEGDGDTALLINAPDGSWHCSDDSYGTTDPTVTFDSPSSGQYDIWVASYSSGENISGTLSITELDSNRPGN